MTDCWLRVSVFWPLVTALMALSMHVRLLVADYTLQVKLVQYSNTGSSQGVPPSARVCCRGEQSVGVCVEHCHNQFLICPQPIGDAVECPLGNYTSAIIPSDVVSFNSPSSMYYIGTPLEFTGTIWTGSVQLYVRVEDIENTTSDLVTEFHIDVSVEPGDGFTDGGTNFHTGSGLNTFLTVQYRVLCMEDYYGPNCTTFCQETNSDLGHYTCDESGSIVCMQGYDDPFTNCTVDLDPCEHTMPCLNGGTCNHTGPDQYMCQCVEQFEGENCQLNKTDECKPEPCQNGATCVDQFNDYNCLCASGYLGKDCDVIGCIPGTCRNGGTCVEDVQGYRCDCAVGYTGSECGVDINECAEEPCRNGGTCKDEVAGYSCTCQPEYTGGICDLSVSGSGSSSGTDVGVIAAGVVTAVLLVTIIVLAALLVLVLRRNRKVVIATDSSKPEPSLPNPLFRQTSQLIGPLSTDPAPGKVTQTDTENMYHKFKNPLYGSSVGQDGAEYNRLTSLSPPRAPLDTNGTYSALDLGRATRDATDGEEDYSHLKRTTNSHLQRPQKHIAQGAKVTQTVEPEETYTALELQSPVTQGVAPGRRKQNYQNLDSPPPPPIGAGAVSDDRVEADHEYDYADAAVKPKMKASTPAEQCDAQTSSQVQRSYYNEPVPSHHSYAVLDSPPPSAPPTHKYDYVDTSPPSATVQTHKYDLVEDPAPTHKYENVEDPTPLSHKYDIVEGVEAQGVAGEAPHDYDYAEPAAKSLSASEKPRNSWPYELDSHEI